MCVLHLYRKTRRIQYKFWLITPSCDEKLIVLLQNCQLFVMPLSAENGGVRQFCIIVSSCLPDMETHLQGVTCSCLFYTPASQWPIKYRSEKLPCPGWFLLIAHSLSIIRSGKHLVNIWSPGSRLAAPSHVRLNYSHRTGLAHRLDWLGGPPQGDSAQMEPFCNKQILLVEDARPTWSLSSITAGIIH